MCNRDLTLILPLPGVSYTSAMSAARLKARWLAAVTCSAWLQGVRLDYALLSKALLNSLESCEIVATPPKWSDHAALLLALKDVPGPEPHPPCALSSARRFGAQPSVAALFSRKRPTASQCVAAAARIIALLGLTCVILYRDDAPFVRVGCMHGCKMRCPVPAWSTAALAGLGHMHRLIGSCQSR